MLVNVPPGLGWGNRKVHPKVVECRWLSIREREGQRLGFPGQPSMEPSLTPHQDRYSKSTPASPRAFNPVGRRRGGEGVDDPWLANMRVKHNSMDVGEAAQKLLDLVRRHAQLVGQLGIGRAGTLLDQPRIK